MAKISELGPITGANTRPEDLFVIVNLVQGDDGTKNISRKELVQAIQYEIFDRITITGGSISGVTMFDSLIRNVVIDDSDMEDSVIIRTEFSDGILRDSFAARLDIQDSTFNNGELTNSTGANLTITDSTFTDGGIFDSTGNNLIITNSEFNDGTANNVVITDSFIYESLFSNGDVQDSNANNIVITDSTFTDGGIFDSTANNVTITDSTFTDGGIFDSTANNVTITDSTFTDGGIFDSTANNVTITDSTFTDGGIFDSTANNVTITDSTFTDGGIFDSTANNVTITNSTFTDGEIFDSTGNNMVITNSEFNDGTGNNNIFDSSQFNNGTANNVVITDSQFNDGDIDNSIFVNGNLNDSDADNLTIVNSDFSNGTGANNLFTDTTLDDSLVQDSEIVRTDFRDGTISNTIISDSTIFDTDATNLTMVQSAFANGSIDDSTLTGSRVIEGELENFEMDLDEVFDPNIDEESWFALKNNKTGKTERITYAQFYDELGKTVKQALKIHVDVSQGRDEWPGSMLQPVKTLERACELALVKAGGLYDRNDVNNAVHISVGPGTYYTKGNLKLPDDCSATSTAGQYATVVEALPGYENNNCWLVGSGGYLQGFSYTNWKVDNFDFPEGGFAVAYRPGAKLRRSPYLRDSSQLSNFLRADVEPPLNPFNSKGTIADLGREIFLQPTYTGNWNEGDSVKFSSGARGYISWDQDLVSNRIYVRNLKNGVGFAVGDTVTCESGGIGIVSEIGIDDFPNPLVGRGGGCVLADRRVLDPDSLYTYVLCFGFTPRTQNGIGYVARDGAGINGIGSLSIFTRCAFYALNGGQVTLNNSGSQFGDISMRAKGLSRFFQPRDTTFTTFQNTAFADTLTDQKDVIIDAMIEHLETPILDGGLGYETYDSQKCERDSGIILDGIGLDVVMDSNYWGRLAGITYRSPISYTVIGDQLEETAGAVRYLQDRVESLFDQQDAAINTRANTSFESTLNILENGEEYASAVTFADTGVESHKTARELLQDNKALISEVFVDWIDNNDEFFAYDSIKCRRDTEEYILPAVKFDAMLDTNYNSITAGNAYYMATANKVIEKQSEETIGAYKQLKDITNELVDSISYLGSDRVGKGFDNILGILERTGQQFTATFATYNPATGEFVITIEDHGLPVGTSVLLEQDSFVFKCSADNYVAEKTHPNTNDPFYNKPIEIDSVTQNTITMNVGISTSIDDHIYMRSSTNSVSVVPSMITFSDDAGISADRRNARKQLQTNKDYIQDHIVGWINDNYYVYDEIKCARDTNDYILPAIERDLALGTNYNSVFAGVSYYTGIASKVISDQLEPTVGAWGYVKNQVAASISGNLGAIYRTDAAADEIIDIITNGTAAADNIVWSDPASHLAYFTPTTAGYNPGNGQSTVTAEGHGLTTDDWVMFAPYSFVFTCDLDSNATQHAYPRVGDANFNTPMQITAVTTDTFTVNVGTGTGGIHTFISAQDNAVIHTSQNSQGYHARINLQANKSFLQQDVLSFLNANYFTFDGAACSRDTGFILDAVKRDIATGSNYHSRYTGLAYRSGAIGADIVISEQLTETVSAINYLKTEVASGLSGGELTRSNAAFAEIIDVLNNGIGAADPIDFGTSTASAAANNSRIILQANRAFIIAEAQAYLAVNFPNHVYDVAACERDTGFLVDAASWDMQHGSNIASGENASFYFENAVTQLAANEKLPTATTFEHLAEVAFQIIRNKTVIVTTGNVETQVQSQPDLGLPNASKARNLMNITADAIRDDRRLLVPEYVEPVVESGYSDALIWINGQRTRLQDDVIDEHLIPTFNGLPYSATKCARDVGFILDAVSKDIEYGGNASTLETVRFYFYGALGVALDDGTPVIEQLNTLPEAQREPTKLAFQHLADVSEQVIKNVTITPQSGNIVSQNTSGTPVNNATGDAVHDLIDIIGVQLDVYKNPVLPTQVSPVADPNQTVARQNLQLNKSFVQQEVISYLDDKYFTYNSTKCSGDTGTLMDAVKRDVLTGSNFNSIFNGLAYRVGTTSAQLVVSDQLNETVAAINYVKQQTALKVTDTSAKTRVESGFNEIIDIMTNGAGSADVYNWGDGALNANRLLGRQKIQENKPFLAAEITSYLDSNFYTYDDAKCERDVGHVIDAAALDLVLGTNYNSVFAGRAYRSPIAASSITDEQPQTLAAFRNLKEEIATVITDAPSLARIDASIDEINDILENDTPDAIVWTDPGLVTERLYARQNLQLNRDFIIAEITAFIDTELPEYDVALCQRDIGYILDAVRRDLILGTDHSTITSGDAYLRTGSYYTLSQQSEYTIAGIEFARDYVKGLVSTPDAQIDVLFQRVIDVLNGTVTAYIAPTYPNHGGSYDNADRTAAKNALQAQRAVMQASVTRYIANQYPTSVYDVADCERDTGYIIDAVTHDILYGGNTASQRAADAYFIGTVSQLGPEEAIPTASAFGYLRSLMNTFVTTATEQARVISLVGIVIDVIEAGSVAGLPAEVEPDLAGLTTTDHDLIQTNTAVIKGLTTDHITQNYPVYDVAKCERDVGFIVDGASHDVQYGGNRATVTSALFYFLDGVNTLPILQQRNTRAAYEHLGSVMSNVAQEVTVTPSTGNLETQVTPGNPASATEGTAITALGTIISEAVSSADTSGIPARVEPDITWVATNFTDARTALIGATSALKTATTLFLNNDYHNELCERDLGYIIDAVRRDLLTGSVHHTVTAANAYLRNASAYVTGGTAESTVKVIAYARDSIVALANITSDPAVTALFQTVIDVLEGTTTTFGTSTYPTTAGTYQTAARIAATQAIQSNMATILADTSAYIQVTYPNIYYDNVKCERDVGYIIDAVRRDLVLGTNHNTVTSANAYLRPTSGYPSNGQNTATTAAVEFARNKLTRLPAVESIGEINGLFDRVLDVLNGSVTTLAESFFPTTEGSTYQVALDRELGAARLQANKLQFQTELTAWIASQVSGNIAPFTTGFVYDGAKCERDVGFIVDAMTHDIKYGGNSSTLQSAIAYVMNAVLLTEQAETAAAFEQLKSIIAAYTTGLDTNIINSVISLLDIVINVINAGNISGIPAEVDIDTTGLDVTEFDQITGSRASIISDTVAYVNTNYPTYNVADCERDTEFVLDAVSFDMKYGGNSATRIAAIAYFDKSTSQLADANETTAAIGAYIELKDLVTAQINGAIGTTAAEETRAQDLIDIIINVLTAGNIDSLVALDEISTTGFVTTEYDELVAEDANIIAASVIWANENVPNGLGYSRAKCERDTRYLLDAVSFDLQHGGNSAVRKDAQMYFTNAYTQNALPSYQRDATVKAFTHLAEVTYKIVNGETVTPSAGNSEGQFVGVSAGIEPSTKAQELVMIVTNVLGAESLAGLPAEENPDTAAYNAGYVTAFSEIDSAKAKIQTSVIDYLAREWNGLGYDQAKCERDTGYIIDAISHDLQYKGNSATWSASNIYFVNAVNILPLNQRAPTRLAFTRLAEVVEQIVQLRAVTPSAGNDVAQTVTGMIANPDTGARAKGLGLMIANTVDDLYVDALPLREEPDYDWVATNYQANVNDIEADAATISSGVVDYIAKNWNGISYSETSCRRDIGFIVDGVSYDVQYGGNRATRTNANIYFENAISVLPASTRRQTADAYEYMGLLVRDVVQNNDTQNATYTTTPQDFTGAVSTNVEGARAQDLIQIIESVIREDDLSILVSEIEPDTNWIDADIITLGTTIDNNTTILADEMIAFIRSEYDVLDYNRAKCQRDVNYLLDAFSWDLNYDSNLASRWNADFYFWNNTLRLPEDQREPTARSYRELGNICASALKGDLEGQVINSGYPTETEVQKVQSLANIFYYSLINNTTKDLPVKEQPPIGWVTKDFVDAQNVLAENRVDLAADTVRFVGSEYRYVDLYLSRRDAGNIIQALVNDFEFINTSPASGKGGSSKSTLTVTASFFDYKGELVFPVFNPNASGLIFKGSLENVAARNALTDQKPNWAYIVADNYAVNHWEGTVYYWDGNAWVNAGANNTDLLESFVGCWDKMRSYIVAELAPDVDHENMVNALMNTCLKDNILRPDTLIFGALVESIAHQFNGASAGVNRNALPLNFRNLGTAISALASVQYEDGGRIRWSGSDELNNQYFARGLRINGRTGRIEGRPFTSSVRKLARRASQSRAFV